MTRTIFIHADLCSPVAGIRRDHTLVVENGRIMKIRPSETTEADMRNSREKIIDLRGRAVIPGLIDAHVHVLQTGLVAGTLDFDACRSIPEVLDVISRAAGSGEVGEWILGRRLDDFKLAEKRPPTGEELTRVGGNYPVFIDHRSRHYALVNRTAAVKLGLAGAAAASSGIVSGADLGAARRKVFASLDQEAKISAIKRVAEEAAGKGVTTLHAMEGGELFGDQDIPLILSMRDKLPVRLVLYWSTTDVCRAAEAGLPCVGGDITLDGTLGSRTAALIAPYADDPETCGELRYTLSEVESFFHAAERAGLQAAVHAIGDRAIKQALDAIEQVKGGSFGRAYRPRIEHFGVPSPSQIERAARLGVIVSTQPAFAFLRGGPGSVYETRLGREREKMAYPLRELVNAGITVAGGSDSDITPLDPLLGIHACVHHPHAEQQLTAQEALALFTTNAAFAGLEEDRVGDLKPGQVADFAVLDVNPLTCAPERLRDIQALMTVRNGRIVYGKNIDKSTRTGGEAEII